MSLSKARIVYFCSPLLLRQLPLQPWPLSHLSFRYHGNLCCNHGNLSPASSALSLCCGPQVYVGVSVTARHVQSVFYRDQSQSHTPAGILILHHRFASVYSTDNSSTFSSLSLTVLPSPSVFMSVFFFKFDADPPFNFHMMVYLCICWYIYFRKLWFCTYCIIL